MPTMRPLAALSVVLSLGALGLAAVPSIGRATADGPDDLLVWGLDANDHRTTVWLHANGRGYEVLGRREGVVVSDGATLRAFAVKTRNIRNRSCGMGFHTDPSHAAEARLVALVSRLPVRRLLAVDVPREEGQYDRGFSVEAGMGPLLLVNEYAYDFSCGAHGSSGTTPHVFDVRDGSQVALLSEEDVRAVMEAHAAEATTRLREELGSDGSDPGEIMFSDAPRVVTVEPYLKDDGTVGARYLFVVDTCYACGDGDWGSYLRGTWIESDRLPARLQGIYVPRAAVEAAHAALAHTELRGFSWVEGAAAAELVRGFAPAPGRPARRGH